MLNLCTWSATAYVGITHTLIALAARLDALAYAGSEARDVRIDFLRGLAVLAMVVDHLAGPSGLYLLTGGNRFFTSAAEAFVLISGVVSGQVYRRIAEEETLGVALLRLLRRARDLYLLTLGLTMIALSVDRAGSVGDQVIDRTPVETIWNVLTLHQTAYLVDVPLLYTLLLLMAPFAVLLMHEGRTWIVVLGSFALWASHQLFAGNPEIPWSIAGNNLFHFAAWQVLFFTGMVLGYHRRRVQSLISRRRQWPLLLASALAFIALIEFFRVLQFRTDTVPQGIAMILQERVFAKNDVQVGRLAASTIVFGFLFLVATKFWVPLRAVLGWFLLPLGQNALYAYTAHTTLALGLPLMTLGGRLNIPDSSNINAVIQVLGVGLIWAGVRFRVLLPTVATRRRWQLVPVPLSAVVLLLSLHYAPPAKPSVPAADANDASRLARVFGTPITTLEVSNSSVESLVPAPVPLPLTPVPVPVPSTPVPVLSPPETSSSSVWPESDLPASSLVQAVQRRIHGSFREVSFHSAALERQMSYYIYTPPQDDTHVQRYPALYMLHGGSGTKDEWVGYGLIDAVDRLIDANEISPLVVVLPQGDNAYWVNQPHDGPRWGDYVAHDLVMNVDATVPTIADHSHRAVGGLSMGGAGALQIAFNNPDVFGVVGAHSPSLHLDDGTFPILGTGADFAVREPLTLAAEAHGIEAVDIWIDVGERDPWLGRDEMLHQALSDRGIAHHWRVLDGGHDGSYWRGNLEMYLHSYDSALNTDRAD